ncbi:molybdopterin-dependent oxidoreductase [Actinomycetospora termitidis]|uniref:Molybdopterin-dependent oxidoreductase n=1 Tax=Actinomycetospora termitidis TaxID=3053470 RepID=A0ABT7MIS7_9PSEU|nr:molybdopterin-dependent oxidoreductase [Actinomycetospora sp. Odt1-22]MDL5159812.1 molybdopterin-dependent oxidoreductase [Actinomycetospora sp. Odt1-22]
MSLDVSMSPDATTKWQPAPARLDEPTTAVEDLYVIGHFGIAHVDADAWRLHVGGAVERPLELSLADLHAMPTVQVQAVLECFGNPLLPDEPTRRAGNVVWTGVAVRTVLDEAGVRDGDLLWAEGHDHGVFDGVPCTEYRKDLPLDVVRERGVLAHAMNGEPLTAEHGFPVRLFVPGYFGTNNVKWLRALTVADHRPDHLFTTTLYQRSVPGSTTLAPVRDLDVISLVTAARRDGPRAHVRGWAWGSAPVTRVEVGLGTDGPEEWVDATLGEPVGGPFGWRRFEAFPTAGPEARVVAARAHDAAGRSQPLGGARNACHVVALDQEP